ncbi:DUF1573 domain-containing protein [Desulfuromonas sp. AOP6]|uniref:DUF1573 domain-containing protein n=1 Tax=Desulfuromonas sp. AOP6 TaxID=1566351 RepID=UPI001271C604|nr:DUF1573 domain-containing protein [Desulfuromonas sp. AOP6]BCA78974.1 hypothetical protein AOP6_0761 [Desulfuromonas sp. AOP6]
MQINGFWAGFLLIFLLPGVALAQEPRLLAESTDFRFGEIYQGQQLEHSFRLENTGDGPLLVEKIRSSCGCTAALLSDYQIQPGQSAQLRVTFDSTRFRGPVVKTVYVYTNDPRHRVAQFYLRGQVTPELVLEPTRVDLGALESGAVGEAAIVIGNVGPQNILIEDIQTDLQDVQATLSSKMLLAGESVTLHIAVAPGEGAVKRKGYVVMSTNSSYTPVVKVPVSFSVMGKAQP